MGKLGVSIMRIWKKIDPRYNGTALYYLKMFQQDE